MPRVGEGGSADALRGEVALQVRVPDRRRLSRAQAIRHAEDDVAAAVLALEAAIAVAEPAFLAVELVRLAAAEIEDAHARDRLGDVLAVGAHVLHGGRTDEAGDAGEALDTRPAFRDRPLDQRVPGLPRARRQLDPAISRHRLDAADPQVDDEAGEALVRDDEVAAPAEEEQRPAFSARP